MLSIAAVPTRMLMVTTLLLAASRASAEPSPEPARLCMAGGVGAPDAIGGRASYDASATGRVIGDRADAEAALSVALGASLWFDVDRCARAQELALDVTATPRWIGATGASIDTAAALRFGPTIHADPDLGVAAWALTSWELGYAGSLRAEPRLADRLDLARDLFDRFTATAATRAFRVTTADVCAEGDRRPSCAPPDRQRTPTPVIFDVVPAEASVGVTEQGARRDEVRASLALFRMRVAEDYNVPVDGKVDLLRVDHEQASVGGVTSTIDTVWPIYIETTNPRTGTRYVIGYGAVAAFDVHVDGMTAPAQALDEIELGGFGLSSGGELRGLGAGWLRTAYLTMAGEPVVESRFTAEGWTRLDTVDTRARLFAARLERLVPAAGQAPVVWTGGAELGGTREVAGLDVDVTFEAGRSYYAALDGGAPTAGWGGRALLTIHHARSAAWQ